MRKQLCDALLVRASRPDLVFLTGDLGFMALEPLQAALGPRFINAGVAEQNMISVAAGMARQGLETWVYSIAPFLYARPFEQIRNDIAFHDLPVKLIGNGGGYGYGVMGPTHHAIEDYGVLLALPHLRAFVPVFNEDIAVTIERAGAAASPCYIRLGRGEAPEAWQVPPYAPWRQLAAGGGPVLIAVGPLAGAYVDAARRMPEAGRPNLWAVSELPLEHNPLPAALAAQIARCGELHVAEEHVARGSFGAELALALLGQGLPVHRLVHHHARAHHYERYGSQAYLRERSGLDAATVMAAVERG
jgi:transketolase